MSLSRVAQEARRIAEQHVAYAISRGDRPMDIIRSVGANPWRTNRSLDSAVKAVANAWLEMMVRA